ncbi:hypothetical protein BDA99DRAFT_513734 [Phascolomyces articulosus]|uniref:Uncharacterized protein n=1 Tax=Phascolomyces articulosus TaxID=60185 RepID=A0AAD5PEK4_9FUNG|nr:hypothetical protein BDA99DRAFT_513734 [Phascolomyces articulosus]
MGVTEHILSLTAPEFVVVVVAGILYGIGAILLFDKSKKYKFFLPYFYLGLSALLMAVGKVFDIVWDKSEGIKNDYPLHASLILQTIGTSVVILALFRLLQVWHQVGLRRGGSGTRTLSILAPVVTFLVMVVSVVGDVLIVKQDQAAEEEGGEEDVDQTHMALMIKFAGSLGNIVLVLVYIGLVIYLAFVTKRRATVSTPTTANLGSIRSNPSLLVPVLLIIGTLILIRSAFYMAMVGTMAFSEDDIEEQENMGWPIYVGLIVVPEIAVILIAFIYDLTQVKNGVEQLHQGFTSLDREMA